MKLPKSLLSVVLLTSALAVALAATGGAVAARGQSQQAPPGPPPGPPPDGLPGLGPLLVELDLTSTQLAQVKALMTAARTASESYQEQLHALGDSLKTAIEADTFDETAVRALVVQESQVKIELDVIRARTEAGIYHLLTADQKAKFKAMHPEPPPPPTGR